LWRVFDDTSEVAYFFVLVVNLLT